MAKSRVKRHGSGKKPTPRVDALTLGERLREALSQAELEALEREIRGLVQQVEAETEQRVGQAAYRRHWAVTMRVLRDRFGWGGVRLMRLWDACLDFLRDLESGMITPEEMLETLEREDGIRIE